MTRSQTVLCLLLSLFYVGYGFMTGTYSRPAFATGVSVHKSRTMPQLFMGMAQPETQIKTKVKVETKEKTKQAQKQKAKTDDPTSRREEDFEDAPMFKLMLLADDGYDVEHVITRMCAIVEDLDEDAAATVFQQAQQEGKAMCGKYPFERAELFKEQLIRSTPMIFSDLEEENK